MLLFILVPLYIGKPAILVVGVLTALLGTGSNWLILAAPYLALLAYFRTDGLSSVPWYELVAKTISPDRRGRMFGTARLSPVARGYHAPRPQLRKAHRLAAVPLDTAMSIDPRAPRPPHLGTGLRWPC
jgi:hypothetical protein